MEKKKKKGKGIEPSLSNLSKLEHNNEMKKMRLETSEKQKEIREEKNRHIKYLIDNDMKHLISTSEYWPPLTHISRMHEEKTTVDRYVKNNEENQSLGWYEYLTADTSAVAEYYPSGFDWMPKYSMWARAVLHQGLFQIIILGFLAWVWTTT
tara:strand:+ start:38 stop:493 length:456 start_codon:yes stop_codon:yes gene_type:complete